MKRKSSDSPSTQRSTDENGRNADMEELRALLVSPEQAELERVDARLSAIENRDAPLEPDELAELLPAAIVARSQRDKKLAAALEPTVEETLRGSVRRNPTPIVEAIFPVIGPAIRRAISEALASTMESVNRTVEHQFSPQGVKWRLEAWRTGRSFSQVVLAHTLLYAVEEIFVVHNETGLPLVHVEQGGTDPLEDNDTALVTSMLTVVQEFVRDSLGGEAGDTLETVEYGDLLIWLESGPRASLAAVIRGTPPRTLRERFQQLIEHFHGDYATALGAFDGDASAFELAEPEFVEALGSQYEARERSRWKVWVFGLLVLALVAFVAFRFAQTRANWSDLVRELDAQPGIVVTEAGRAGGQWYVNGLRDPMAVPVDSIVARSALRGAAIRRHFEPYQTSASEIVAQRASRVLDAPESVDFEMFDEVLTASGAASNDWILEARRRAELLFAVAGYDDAAVENLDLTRALSQVDQIEGAPVSFPIGQTRPSDPAAIQSMVVEVAQVVAELQRLGKTVVIHVVGSATPTGTDETNEYLSRTRAVTLAEAIRAGGVPSETVAVSGVLEEQPSARLRFIIR